MPTLTAIDQLKLGDFVDLENDIWADSPLSMFEPSKYAGEYAVVETIVRSDEEWFDITFENGETVAFPEHHQLPKMRR